MGKQGSVQQVINKNGKECLNEKLNDLARQVTFKNIHPVGVIGLQSSGKSALLNVLFNTPFSMMDITDGEHRQTEGINVALSSHPAFSSPSSAFLVVDVEGSDGSENPDMENYEGQLALFAMAVCEVLIINMEFKNVNRNNAGNRPLIQRVCKAAFRMNVRDKKTTLLFVIRDYVFKSPLHTHEENINKMMRDIWNSGGDRAGRRLEDVFDIVVFPLPNLAPDGVPILENDPLRKLRDRVSKDVLKISKAYSSVLSVGRLAVDLWPAIQSNADLNVLSRREILARSQAEQDTNEVNTRLWSAVETLGRADADNGAVNRISDLEREKQACLKLFEERMQNTKEQFPRVYFEWRKKLDRLVSDQVRKYADHQEKLLFKRENAEAKKGIDEARKKIDEVMKETKKEIDAAKKESADEKKQMSSSLDTMQANLAVEKKRVSEEIEKRIALADEIARRRAPYTASFCSLGTDILGDKLSPLIARGARLPASTTKGYVTTVDLQDAIEFKVLAGDDPTASGNRELGSVRLEKLARAPKEKSGADVTFELGKNGHLRVVVTAKDYPWSSKTEYFTVPTYTRDDY